MTLRSMWVLTGSNSRHNCVAYFGRSNSGYCIAFVLVRTVSEHCVSDIKKTRNFVTFHEFLIHIGVHHTTSRAVVIILLGPVVPIWASMDGMTLLPSKGSGFGEGHVLPLGTFSMYSYRSCDCN